MIDRRLLMIGGAALAARPAWSMPDRVAAIEATLAGGRVGFAAIDLAGGRRLGHRIDERFALCSTVKLPLAAAVLAAIDAGRIDVGRRLPIHAADLLPYAPAVRAALPAGVIGVLAVCEAAVGLSDNSAANLLLPLIGGPAGLTRFMARHGAVATRSDRPEPDLNVYAPGDPRDTTTPLDMARLAARLLTGPVLAPASRARLIGWMIASPTGAARLRGGLPAGWRAGDKTGTGPDGEVNDVAIVWGPGRAEPLVMACYVDAPGVPPATAEAAHRALSALAVAALR